MSLLESLKALIGRGTHYEDITYVGPTVTEVMGMGPEDLFRTQPHLRTVISFRARNIAQLPLQVFRRVSDTDRQRVTDDPVARLLSRPNPNMTSYELLNTLVADFDLYDVAIWMIAADTDAPSGWSLWPIPPSWVQATGGGTAWGPQWVEVIRPSSGKRVLLENLPGEVPQFIMFHGFHPGDPSYWSSPVESLKQVLAEQIQAWSYREQVWQRGGRVGTYIVRPANVPWSSEAREKFSRDWLAKWTGPNGPKAGGTPIMEDGMELKSVRFNAREEEWSEVAKLSLATVAAVYHTSPTMVGILDNANYSNVREFHQMLYTDTLGPMLRMIEQRINTFLLPVVSKDPSLYVEFNLQAKLAGSFEEQAAVISSSVGAPWMTRNEARARLNLPQIDDGDRLVTPLNVLIGGQASPRDSGSQNAASAPATPVKAMQLARDTDAGPVRFKTGPGDAAVSAVEQVVRRFFERQASVVLSRLGAKSPAWWDGKRWDEELSDDLFSVAMTVSKSIARNTLDALGFDPDVYDSERTTAFLRKVADVRAANINATTLTQLQAALSGDVAEGALRATIEGVFDIATTSRSEQLGRTLSTTFSNFASSEAVKQTGRPSVTKTWVTTSTQPRQSHAAMNGETVDREDTFSNGMQWPGDVEGANYDFDEISNCQCVMEYTIP